ncbi:hypothetical protein AMTR_s00041p00078050 [Amborella trichopoda]|uniref:Uncharacterized protein n=1 Tax=Amborella trichopoda TaxID=13333 RepID=W1Q089_AMBTC|nr:hypothetical protein AMTR_s00041p00078050 [Amborella trichopoda]
MFPYLMVRVPSPHFFNPCLPVSVPHSFKQVEVLRLSSSLGTNPGKDSCLASCMQGTEPAVAKSVLSQYSFEPAVAKSVLSQYSCGAFHSCYWRQ